VIDWPTPQGFGDALQKDHVWWLIGGLCAIVFGSSAAPIESVSKTAIKNDIILFCCISFILLLNAILRGVASI
jgi:hypothetical protein